jgi:hypothetical protein
MSYQWCYWVAQSNDNAEIYPILFLLLIHFLLLCLGFIVAFTKFLTLYQIYHTWIHSLYHSPLSPPPFLEVSTGIRLLCPFFLFSFFCGAGGSNPGLVLATTELHLQLSFFLSLHLILAFFLYDATLKSQNKWSPTCYHYHFYLEWILIDTKWCDCH